MSSPQDIYEATSTFFTPDFGTFGAITVGVGRGVTVLAFGVFGSLIGTLGVLTLGALGTFALGALGTFTLGSLGTFTMDRSGTFFTSFRILSAIYPCFNSPS